MIIKDSKFEVSAVSPKQYPSGDMPENQALLILCLEEKD